MRNSKTSSFRYKISFLIIALLMLAFSVNGQELGSTFALPSPRNSAVGGSHAALTSDLSTLLANPAGFISAPVQMSLSELTIAMSGPIFDITSVLLQSVTQDISNLLQLSENLYASADIVGPVYFGYVGNGLGFGFFNTTNVKFTSPGPLALNVVAGEQLMLAGGYALRIPFGEDSESALDLGVLLKGALKGEIDFTSSLLALPTLLSSLGVDLLLAQPFRFVSSIGFDAGIRFSYSDVFAIGIVGRDIFTPTLTQSFSTLGIFLDGTENPAPVNGTLPLDLTVGLLFSPRLGVLERFINDIRFMLDYKDILDFLTHPATARNPVLHASFGMDLTFLQILAIRAGFNQGLFAAGIGLDLTIFKLNVAMFGTELSTEPGLRPVFNMQVGFEFRI